MSAQHDTTYDIEMKSAIKARTREDAWRLLKNNWTEVLCMQGGSLL